MEMYEQARAAGSDQVEAMEQQLRKEERNLSIMIKKQEKVLFVGFHLLMNMAEDLQIEKKMVSRGIIKLLM